MLLKGLVLDHHYKNLWKNIEKHFTDGNDHSHYVQSLETGEMIQAFPKKGADKTGNLCNPTSSSRNFLVRNAEAVTGDDNMTIIT